MKVLCTNDNFLELTDPSALERIKKYINLPDGQLNLKRGAAYTVYGLVFRDNAPWYYLCYDEEDTWPKPYPAELFRITDPRLSSCWRLSTERPEIVFEEWAADRSFYERLLDGDPSAKERFSFYRKLMDQE